MKSIFFILSISLLFRFTASAQYYSAVPGFIRDSLDQYIEKAMTDWQIPGMAVGIVKNGKIVMCKGYGHLGMNNNRAVNDQSLFMIGSNTKAFTATALALLEDEKNCSLNDKVIRWLPDFKMKDPWLSKEVSLTDLLCHRIGLESYQGDFVYWASNLKAKQVVDKFGKITPSYSFRSKYGYTNAGFLIAGECIAKISGTLWAVFLKNMIFDPLQMTRTQALSTDFSKQDNASAAYTRRNDTLIEIPIEDIDNLNAAGSMGSSASDMCHWLLCQLDSGRYEGKQIIPFNVIEKTRTPQTIVGLSRRPFNNSHFALYGLGWRLIDYEGKEIIAHAGAVDGFHSSVSLLPEIGLGIVILTNTDVNDFYEALKWDIIDAYLNLPARNYSEVYIKKARISRDREQAKLRAWRDSANLNLTPQFKLEKYAGVYINEVYGKLTITSNSNNLVIHFEHHPYLTGLLQSLGENRFLCTYSNSEFGIKVLNFEATRKKPVSLILRVSEDIDDSPYIFKKK
jgi:CubicO group peptidase (beta-lactamase class C family)